MYRTSKKTKRNPIPVLTTKFTLAPSQKPVEPGQRPTFEIVGEEHQKGASGLTDSELSELVAYFDERVRSALLTDELPLPFFMFNSSGNIEYEVTLSRISERERVISYYQHGPIKTQRRKPAREILLLQTILTIGYADQKDRRKAIDDLTDADIVIVGSKRVPDGSSATSGERIIRLFEDEVRRAVTKDEPFQQIWRHHSDSSMSERVTIARISEFDRLVSYYSYPLSRPVLRKLAREAQERRKRGETVHLRDSAPKPEPVAPKRSLPEWAEYYKTRSSTVGS